MLSKVFSATLVGAEGQPVTVEVHVSNGLPGFRVVGLPDASCREARDRVRAAILSSGCSWPQKRVTVNLAPSGLRKGGPSLDLAIAIGTLAADGQVPAGSLEDIAFLGELGLDGSLRGVPGVLAMAASLSTSEVAVPPACAHEAQLAAAGTARTAWGLEELVGVLRQQRPWPDLPQGPRAAPCPRLPDLADVRGQAMGRRALEVSAAGGHHLLMVGPAGSGKTMLAKRLPGLLPELSPQEALEVAKIRSAAGLDVGVTALPTRPPFRAPHHSASAVSLIGGGGHRLRPGEVSCATNGVLFLDELAEFPGAVLDNLRQPLEEGRVVVCRASAVVSFPARFLLVAAMNPCRCPADGSPGSCSCPERARQRYLSRVSGPLLDRFDLRVHVRRPEVEELMGFGPPAVNLPENECSSTVAGRVAEARGRARERGARSNSELSLADLDVFAPLSTMAARALEARLRDGSLTARGLHRVRRVALTVADLGGHEGALGEEHVLLALALRAPVLSASGRAGPGASGWGFGANLKDAQQ